MKKVYQTPEMITEPVVLGVFGRYGEKGNDKHLGWTNPHNPGKKKNK